MKDPLTVLEELQTEQYLLVFETTGQEPDKEQTQLDQDFRLAFGRAVDRLASRWGEPDFLGGWDDPDFPDWYDAVMMACWNRPDTLTYLAYQWSGPATPLLIAMGQQPT